jgi:hypothetical protein
MLATKVVCPNCSRTLKTATALPVGKKVLCRQCGTTFSVTADNSPRTPAPSRRLAPAPVAEPVAPAPGGLNKVLLFGGVLAALLLLMVVGAAAVVGIAVLRNRDANRQALAPETRPAPKPDEGKAKALDYGPPVPELKDTPPAPAPAETPPEKVWLPKEQQDKVDEALERGLAYLRKQQNNRGFWDGGAQELGMGALPALTLLECGAKADDPAVVKAADFVRSAYKNSGDTYSLALSILFLDRLGDANDRPHIQAMALRLVAGQTANGGWSYHCPILNEKDQRDLLAALQQARPGRPPEAILDRPGGRGAEIIGRPGEKTGDGIPDKGGAKQPTAGSGQVPEPPTKVDLKDLSPVVKRVQALQPPDAVTKGLPMGESDNSNTQFAILAMWVAGRHGVPTERVGALIERRFRTSQADSGAWGYNYFPKGGQNALQASPAMTCAGLLGLAVGHGVSAPNLDPKAPVPNERLEDEGIKKGMQHLSEHLGKSQAAGGKPRDKNPPGLGLYYLWSVERVGVMYNLRTIGDKDWYGWGSEILVDRQNPNGSWTMGNYFGSSANIDTSFALLFLKRANLAKDLSTKIEYLIDIKGVGNRN